MRQQLSLSRKTQFFNQRRRQILLVVAAGLTGCSSGSRSQNMVNTEKYFKSFPEYWSKVTFWNGSLPGKTLTSYPVPVLRQGQVQIAYMVCPYTFGPKGSWIWPPNKVFWCDPVSGKSVAEISVLPDYFDQKDAPNKQMKENISLTPGMTRDIFDNLKRYLFELYEILFEAWENKYSTTNNGKLQSSARDFLKIFDQVSEKPLRPYYNALGSDWFEWLRKLAG
jgi:hypothetical protein